MSYKTKKENSEFLKRWKQKHREAGLCTYCKKKATPGKTLCPDHRRYFRDYHKEHKVMKNV
jgi:predicted amidophosphoribosyltransferase